MLINFGTGFYGKIADHKGHWIESKFFYVLFVPLFPVGSMFVTGSEFRKRNGFEMGIHTKSVIAVYGRMFTTLTLAGVLFLMYDNMNRWHFDLPEFITEAVIALLLLAACVYFWVWFGKPNAEDIAMREKVHSVAGVYALPHWIDHSVLYSLYERYTKLYKERYPDDTWQRDLTKPGLDQERKRMLYGIALFNCMVHNIPENDELYVKADELYKMNPY